jgi:hypothetical protein
MALLRHVQHDRLGLRGFRRLPLVASRNPPSTYQGSGIRQSHSIDTPFREPFSLTGRTPSASISDFRFRNCCGCNALSLHRVSTVFRHRTLVPLCSASLLCICTGQAVSDTLVVGTHAGAGSGFWRNAGVCWTAGVVGLQEI